MADGSSAETAGTSEVVGESSESLVEINVKTLDSQIYHFQVDKNMPVTLLKEKVANATGVPVEQQRLIFRGKVLKDDHLLSQYHVEDGHTLHLVARQPIQSQTPAETNRNNDNRANEASSDAPRNRIGQVSHSVLLGSFNVGEQGEGSGPDLTRIIGAVLNSIGIGNQIPTGAASNMSSGIPANASSQASQGVEADEARGNNSGTSQASQGQPGQAFPNHPFLSPSQSLQFPLPGAAVAVPSAQVPIPDALHTLSVFISRMEQVLSAPGYQPSPTPAGDRQTEDLPSNDRGIPTPEALSIILRQAQQLLSGHATAALSHIAGRLEQENSYSDPTVRNQIQTESVQVGLAMQHLGALFLELGRTMLTLRMGQSPAESLVNAGHAVYISPSGPNPIMVQPLSLQASSLFGGSVTSRANSGMMAPVGLGDLSRNVNIHIHAVGSRENTGDASNQVLPNGTHSGDSGSARVLPMRNVIATTGSSRSSAEAANQVLNALNPQSRTAQSNRSHEAPTQNVGVAGSSSVQTSLGNSVTPPPSDSADISTFVSQINAQLHSLVNNMQGDNQVPPDQAENSNVQVTATGIDMDDNVGTDKPEKLAASESGQTSGSSAEQQQPGSSQLSSDDLAPNNAPSTSSRQSSLSSANEEVTLPRQSEDSSEGASKDGQSHDPAGLNKAVPLGLGLGGLQSRRQIRQAKSQGKSGSGMSSNLPVNERQQSISSGQRVLQSLVSQGSDTNTRNASQSSGQLPSVFSQVMESMPMGAQGTNGQLDAASMMSQVLNSPALNGLLAGVSEQAGIGSPDGLRSMLEQFTQSPSMRNTLNSIVRQMDDQDIGNFQGVGGGQSGGLDLSRMVQQMMPIVSQALASGSTNAEQSSGLQPADQQHLNMSNLLKEEKPVEADLQIDLRQAAQRIERHDPPGEIFHSVVQHASALYGGGSGSEDIIEELCRDEDLASEYMAMLQRNVRQRLQEDSGSAD